MVNKVVCNMRILWSLILENHPWTALFQLSRTGHGTSLDSALRFVLYSMLFVDTHRQYL